MNELSILGEIRKQQTILQVTDIDLMKVAGLSRQTFRRRVEDPKSIRLGELTAICNYLGIKTI